MADTSTETAPSLPTGAFMPLVSLRKRWRLALIILAAVVVLGIPVAWLKGKATYSVTATLYVAPHFVGILKDSKELDFSSYQQFRQFVEHQALTVNRYDILVEALRRLGDRRHVWQKPKETERRAAERLQAALKIVAVENSYLITVTLESTDQDGLNDIVNMVLDTFLEKNRNADSFFASDQRVTTLRERRKSITDLIADKVARRNKIAEQLGVTSFSTQATNPYDELLLESQNALAKAQRDRIASESALFVLEDNNSKLRREAVDAAIHDTVQADPGLTSLKGSLYKRRSELLQQISGLEDRHPLAIQSREELKEIDGELDRMTAEVSANAINNLLERHRSNVRRDRQIEAELQRQLGALRQQSSVFAALFNEAVNLSDELERSRKTIEDIDNRIEFFDMESHAPGFLRVESYALPAELPIKGGRKKMLIMVLIAGLGLGAGVPIMLDMLDKSIKTPNQIIKIIGHPPLAGLLERTDDLSVRRVRADQLRRLAITLDRERLTHDNRVILVTSVKPGAGVTGLAFELGNELAEMGVRAVVVETNPFKPDVRYAGEGDQPGLLDLLVDTLDIGAAVAPASAGFPERMSVGFALNPHLFAYSRLRERLDEIKKRYDVVLLDAPPILLSGDTEYLAGISDISLVLIGARQVLPGELRRAAGIMQKVNPPVIGFIVTRLQIYQGGGYYAKQVEEYEAAEVQSREILKTHPLRHHPS
jgi:Mrp family chromosome partitioning ATPase